MAKSNETKLAEHEIRLGTLERLIPELTATLKSIDKKLDENYIARREYDKRVQDQELYNQSIKHELDEIRTFMMTKTEFKEFARSQFWQKVLTFLGGLGTAVILWFLVEELSMLIGG